MNCRRKRFWWSTTVSPCIDTNGESAHLLKATASNSSASLPGEKQDWLDLPCAFHNDAHPITLDDSHWCFPRNEFAFGNYIDNVIGETRFAAGPQHGDGCALDSGRERQCSCEVSRRAGQR